MLTAQQKSVDQDKRYAIKRGDNYMVHDAKGNRVYNGIDKEEALRMHRDHTGSIFTDLTDPVQRLTEAETIIEKVKASARRCNSRYVTVNLRNGKAMYSGNDRIAAVKAQVAGCKFFDLNAPTNT